LALSVLRPSMAALRAKSSSWAEMSALTLPQILARVSAHEYTRIGQT
jgi:hypothetical protein